MSARALSVVVSSLAILASLVAAALVGGRNALVVFVIGYGCGTTVACLLASGFDLLARADRGEPTDG